MKISLALVAATVVLSNAVAQTDVEPVVTQSMGVDRRIDYVGLQKYGPWDDRNYRLTAGDLRYLSPDEHKLENQLPAFFRVELRKEWPHLRKSGPAQYPRAALQLFYKRYGGLMRNGKIATDRRKRNDRRPLANTREVQLNTILGANEITVEINPVNPNLVIAGANNAGGQEMYYSSDGGVTWTIQGVLPDTCCDPTIDWSSDGSVAYVGALSGSIGVSTWRSFDNGQTWVDRVDLTATGSDKEFIHVDRSLTSPFQDNLYVTYHNGNVMQFARSTDQGATFDIQAFPSAPFGIGSDITTDSDGTIYYAYGAFSSQTITLLRSTDGGNTFGSPTSVASTNGSFDFPIPAMETRSAWIYVAAGADRSGGALDGSVYLAWADTVDPESPVAEQNHTRVHVAHSRDGGDTWTLSTPHPTDDMDTVDRFNPWMTVDEFGNVHVVFYDTRNSVDRTGVDLYYTYSADGGVNWSPAERVSSATSANLTDGQEWGDYNGISVVQDRIVSTWTDNRNGPPDAKDVYADDALNPVAEPGYVLIANPTSLGACAPAQLDDITVSVGSVQGYADPVTLSLSELPSGFTGGFTIPTVTPTVPANTSVAQVSVASVAEGNYSFNVNGSTGTLPDKVVPISVSISNTTPPAAGLLLPANGASDVLPVTDFSWSPVAGAIGYTFEIDDDPAFGSIDFTSQVDGTSLSAPVALGPDTKYHWRVRATNLCGAGPDSATFSFTTGTQYCSVDFGPIPDGLSSAQDQVRITSPDLVGDMDVLLQVTHTWVGDLIFVLVHVDTATTVTLIDRPGVTTGGYGCSGDNIDATLDDEGSAPAESACAADPALGGNLIPNEPLSAFDYESLAGTWTLTAADVVSPDPGTVDGWCLIPQGLDPAGDEDGDGVPNGQDQCPTTPPGVDVDENGCEIQYPDSDRDGVDDPNDICPSTPRGQAVDAQGCSVDQLRDDDNDGIPNSVDECPATPAGQIPDSGGCSSSERDRDRDGVRDNLDACPDTPRNEPVDGAGCGPSQLDDDSDGVANLFDECPNTPSGSPINAVGCAFDQLEEDYDGDGVPNGQDACPGTAAGSAVDATGCSSSQPDVDGDGILDANDNCIRIANPGQADGNGDGYGDVCDPDLDNDGIVTTDDLRLLRSLFGTSEAAADFNIDGIVDQADAEILTNRVGQAPGPSGTAP